MKSSGENGNPAMKGKTGKAPCSQKQKKHETGWSCKLLTDASSASVKTYPLNTAL